MYTFCLQQRFAKIGNDAKHQTIALPVFRASSHTRFRTKRLLRSIIVIQNWMDALSRLADVSKGTKMPQWHQASKRRSSLAPAPSLSQTNHETKHALSVHARGRHNLNLWRSIISLASVIRIGDCTLVVICASCTHSGHHHSLLGTLCAIEGQIWNWYQPDETQQPCLRAKLRR